MSYWAAARKLAWRDWRRSRGGPILLAAAMAASVAAISGVRSAAGVARSALERDSREWLGGDLAATTGEPIDVQQYAGLEAMARRGIEWTEVTTALTMGASSESPDPALMAVKAVDPASYPLYGALETDPRMTLAGALAGDTAVVSKDAMARFDLKLGNEIRIGGKAFRVAAAIAREPDRFSSTPLGVRCLLSDRGFERSGIARSGDSVRRRILLRLPDGANEAAVRAELAGLFPGADLTDYREANRAGAAILETAIEFLNVTALLALALGGVGLGMAARQHIEERGDALAVMKMLGAGNRQLAGIFLVQMAGVASVGLAVGIPLGWEVRAGMLAVASRYVVLPHVGLWDGRAILDTAAAGLAALVPALGGTARTIARLRPAASLRRNLEPSEDGRTGALGWAIAVAAMGAMAAGLLRSWKLAAVLTGVLAGSAGLALLLAEGALAAARRWVHSGLASRTPLWRTAIANLGRPGYGGRNLIAALALGMMTLTVTLELERAVTRSILEDLPFDRPDLVVPVVEAARAAEVRAFLEKQPGVGQVDAEAQARGRLTDAGGRKLAAIVGCAAEGHAQQVEVAENVARRMGLRLGSKLRFMARGRTEDAIVTSIRPMTRIEENWRGVRMDCSGLDPDSLFWHIAARVRKDRIAAVRRAFLREYPAIPVGAADDLAEVIGQVGQDALGLTRLVAWQAVGSGLAVLIAVVAAARGKRLRETAILAVLGARRRTVAEMWSVEFAALGVLAGAIGGVLAWGFTAAMVSGILRDLRAPLDWRAPALGMAAAGILCVAAGWLPAHRMLRRRPLETLREE